MARATENSRTQHAVLRRLADELLALLDKQSPLDGTEVRAALDRIGAAVTAHVAMEVEVMYPRLLEHADAEVRELAAKMIPRVKDISDGYFTFQNAWSPERIRTNPEAFQRQVRFVADVLRQSTLHEEANLYERIDATAGEDPKGGEGK
jgi:hypothetical protein